MNHTTRLAVRFGIPLGVVIVSALASLIILDAVDFDSDPASPAEGARSERTSSLSFCVDTYNLALSESQSDALRDDAKKAVEDALMVVESAAPEHVNKLEDEGTRYVDKSCPGTPVLSRVSADDWKDGFYNGPPPPTVAAEAMMSPYRYHLYVLTEAELDERIQGRQRTLTQESRCTDHVCVPLTWSVYVTPEELNDLEFMTVQMEILAGLREG